jgi:hypothetical protein
MVPHRFLMQVARISLISLLASCTPSQTVILPDGEHGYAISCDGPGSSMIDCARQASSVCRPYGYNFVYVGIDPAMPIYPPPGSTMITINQLMRAAKGFTIICRSEGDPSPPTPDPGFTGLGSTSYHFGGVSGQSFGRDQTTVNMIYPNRPHGDDQAVSSALKPTDHPPLP